MAVVLLSSDLARDDQVGSGSGWSAVGGSTACLRTGAPRRSDHLPVEVQDWSEVQSVLGECCVE